MNNRSLSTAVMFLVPIFFPFLCCAQENIPQTSLFFTPQETYDASHEARKIAPAGKGDLRLDAIIYYGDNDWTLWLQGERWTPDTIRENIKILRVTPTEATFDWKEGVTAPPQKITLKPNQYYQISTGKIIAQP